MRFASISINGMMGLAAETEPGSFRALFRNDPGYPGDLKKVIAGGEEALARAYETLLSAQQFGSADFTLHPPIADPNKIICVGLNYRDHTQEVGFEQPEYPTLFARFSSSLVAAGDPIVCPEVSDQFDYEGELVAIIGKAGRDIPLVDALDHVAGHRRVLWRSMAHPTRFERVTFAFGGQRSSHAASREIVLQPITVQR
jgi:acylpyruvate hydrolase